MKVFGQQNSGAAGNTENMGLDKDLIINRLTTGAMGRSLEIHSSIGSTNIRARELALAGAPHGTAVIADEQLQGRGRLGRTWISPGGTGIWMSVVLRPGFAPEDAAKITVMAALGVSDAIFTITGSRALIKWPNDLVLGSKKLCGILTEIQTKEHGVDFVIAGIGINVNGKREDFPPELTCSATSLYLETGRTHERCTMIAEVLNYFEAAYEQYIKTGDFSTHTLAYKNLCATLNKRVRVYEAAGEFEGTATGVTEDCTLLVRLDDGRIREIISGDVSVRGIAGYI